MLELEERALRAVNRVWKGVAWRANRLYAQSVYRRTFMHRRKLKGTLFVGVTGSTGKSTTKDLVARILERNLPRGQKGEGTANFSMHLAELVLRTRKSDAYCVAEICTIGPGYIDLSLELVRPSIGIVTNIGGDHYSAFGSLDGIAEEKGKLIAQLPPDGIAVLNADDPRVLAMRSRFAGRTVTYGTSPDAMLRCEDVSAAWPDRLALTVAWNGQSVRVQTQLCGSHWVPVVLAAMASAAALEIPLAAAAAAIASVEPFEGRMSPVVACNAVTYIRDDWKAPFWTIAPTLDFMREARASRKIIVVGTISDCPGDSSRRYAQVARQAMAIADCVIFVGSQSTAALRAKREPVDKLFAFPSIRDAVAYLRGYLRAGDLVLLKGNTRTDHLERLLLAANTPVQCWRTACGRVCFCNACDLLHVSSSPTDRPPTVAETAPEREKPILDVPERSVAPTHEVVVIGLGNPEAHRADTRHNVGFRAVEILAERIGATWQKDGTIAEVARGTLEGRPLLLVKPLAPVNDIGPVLLQVSRMVGFVAGQCVLIHDDLDLPLGTVRRRNRGGDGGHRGVRSILQAFQDDRFRRVKIGIGKPEPGQPVADYVLSPFPPEQQAAVDAANKAAAEEIMELISPVAA